MEEKQNNVPTKVYLTDDKLDNVPTVWHNDSLSREQQLLKRKQFMMQQARL